MHRTLLAAIVFAVALFASTGVRAWDTLLCSPNFISRPASGEVGVPTNTRLWINDEGTELRDPSGRVIPLERTEITNGACPLRVFRPTEELQPRTRYELPTRSWFETGDGPSTMPRPIPVIRSSLGVSVPPNPAGAFRADELNVDARGNAVVVVDADGASRLDEGRVEGTVSQYGSEGRIDVDVGWAPSVTVRVGGYDLAGHFSGWSPPDTQVIPPVFYLCTCTRASPRSSVALIAFVVVVVVRNGLTAGRAARRDLARWAGAQRVENG